MVNKFVTRNKTQLLGALAGAIAGYLYYHFIGCSNGSCMIASRPYISVPYFAVMGYLFTLLIKK